MLLKRVKLPLVFILVFMFTQSVKSMNALHPAKSTFYDVANENNYENDGSTATHKPIILPVDNPCELKFCGKGHECQVGRDGQAQCICQRSCRRHVRLVCGSDGNLYFNHCELHRASCLMGVSITVDRKNDCLKNKAAMLVYDSTPGNSRVERVEHQTQSAKDLTSETVSETSVVIPTLPTKIDVETPKTIKESTENDPCSVQEYEILKDNLLLFNHAKLMNDDGKKTKNEADKDYLVSVMFSHYDQNNNGGLDSEELQHVAQSEHLDQLSSSCGLTSLITFDDTDKDGQLSINEFYTAFSKLYSVSMVSLDKSLEINHVIAHVGDNVEIKCDVVGTPTPPIVWRRNDVDLSTILEDDVKVFVDGTLYLTRVQLIHAGNYTCHAQSNRDVIQTHVLHVETVPQVRVMPRIQSRKPGEEVTIKCHANGVPLPSVHWLKNDEELKMAKQKYSVVGNGTSLAIRKIVYSDTGAYMCVASNSAGTVRDISSLVVQDDPTPTSPNEELRFFVFHDLGISVYDPATCRLYHQIQGTDIIPGTQEYVCGEKGVNCSWGRAINVADRYIYVSQPSKDRLLVISKTQMVVVDVIVTDKIPVQLFYVAHLDQVWLLCWRSPDERGTKTIQIIRDASQKKKHHTVHPEPVDGHFDLVGDLFIPESHDTGHKFRYGYATHTNQRGMYKVDLAAMKYVRTVDLTPYNCVPQGLAFSSVGGLVVVECIEPITNRPTGQLVLDYMTDSVLVHKPNLYGTPHVSPDSLHIVTIDRRNHSVTIVAQETSQNAGLKFLFDVKTTLNVSDITFYPSKTSHSYDLYASSNNKEDILFVNLANGKVEMITGVGKAMEAKLAQWGNVIRPITGSGVFGNYMVTPAEEALFVVNGQTHTVNCEIGSLFNPRLIVWVTAAL
ncbi:hypothetical protein CHUAL_001187 [Chamberlinius hualienensis]